jgi:ArsR family transcriptional regulator
MKKPAQAICCAPPPKNEGKRLKVAIDDREFATLAKALGHPARVKILRYVAGAQACICGDIVAQVGLAQATVSQHLKVLKAAGLLRGTVSGPKSCYCLESGAVERLQAHLQGLLK